ncbi:MAG: class I SAM-dependent methyltransferase [Candidatus Curtissbacteria bacterium]|nr:class I SAM-dependent methyltransferase [Candidatus Curtissbacteria bacterium]
MTKSDLYEIWSRVPVDYYQKGVRRNPYQRIWHERKIRKAKSIIRDLKFKKVLDVGCASGFMLSQIAREFPNAKYFGIDAYDKAIEFANKKYSHINFKVGVAEKLPYKDESFDLIICYETMEHVTHPKVALLEMRRVLKKDGALILAMDSGSLLFRAVWFVWENTKGRVWQDAHLHPFHHEELEALIKRTKWKVRKKFFTHFGMEVVFVLQK